MPLSNCKIHLELNWTEDCILYNDGDSAKFKITDVKFHVTIVTLSTKDNVNLTKQLSDRFKRSAYWNSYQTISAEVIEKGKKYKWFSWCIISRFLKIICYFLYYYWTCFTCSCRWTAKVMWVVWKVIYNQVNAKLSDSQLHKLKFVVKKW